MRALFAGELRRSLARRLVRVVFLIVAGGIVVASVITFFRTHAITEAAYQAKVQSADSRFAAQNNTGGVPLCPPGENQPPVVQGPRESQPPAAQASGGEQLSCIPADVVHVHDPRLHLTSLKGVFEGVTAPLVILSLLIGASVIGAEWPSRTITTILTWEPRRFRVLTAKVLSATLVGAVLTILGLTVLGLGLLPSALVHGTTAGTTGAWWQSLGGVLLRAIAMSAIGTMMGFSIPSIGRNTGAALAVLFAYVVVIEHLAAAFITGAEHWLILGNAGIFVSGNPDLGTIHRSVVAAGVYLAAISIGLFAIAAALFQRRDVA